MRFSLGVPLGCLGLAMATSTCGGANFTLDGQSDASIETGAGSSSGSTSSGNGGSSGNSSSGGGSGNGSGGGSGSGSSSGTSGSGGNGSSGGGASSSSGGSSGSTGSGGSSGSGGHVDAGADGGNDGGAACDCNSDPSCCTPMQLCCAAGPIVVGGGSYHCITPTTKPPKCPAIVSDRNVKRDIQPVDERAILQGVANMSISTWSYKTDDPSVRHLGPMAQDFYSEFGLGDTDRGYYSVDAHGVALAAIKALAEQMKEQSARIEHLERENRELQGRAACGR
jgi:endosialidase-like protein